MLSVADVSSCWYCLAIPALVVVYYVLKYRPIKDFRGSVVVITGGAGALGRALTDEFLSEQAARVVLLDLYGAEKAAEEVNASTGNDRVVGYTLDVTDRERVIALAATIEKDVGPVDVLVNNAGILPAQSLFEQSLASLERVMQVNSLAHFWTVRGFVPSMLRRNKGTVISVASSAAYFPVPRMVSYSASKAAAVAFAQGLRQELRWMGASGVSVTCVCPYAIDTPLITGWKEMKTSRTLTVTEVARATVKAARRGAETVFIPWDLNLAYALRLFFPLAMVEWIGDRIGLNDVCESFQGRGESFNLGKGATSPSPRRAGTGERDTPPPTSEHNHRRSTRLRK